MPDSAVNDMRPTFRFYEHNPRRAARGAEAVRMEVIYMDGSSDLLWMSERDVRRNVMAFGRCAELDKALAAYGVSVLDGQPVCENTPLPRKDRP